VAKIVIETGMRKGAEFTLGAAVLLVGRAPEADIAIPDRMASRQHLRFAPDAGGYSAEDMGSSNGTLYNNKPLAGRVKLNDRDEMIIGTTVLRFHAQGVASAPPPPLSEAQKARGQRDTVAAPSRIDATRPAVH
jgi:pSer/pThr/pTyr-binding forkhead associated (FHA) protein